MKAVFGDIMTRIAVCCHVIFACAEVAISISIITNKATTMGCYPHESITIGVEIINKIARKSIHHVQISDVVLHDKCRLSNRRKAEKAR